jgi:hypothetical protein
MAKALARQANSTYHATVDFLNRPAHVSARLGDLIFRSILSNANDAKPNQMTSANMCSTTGTVGRSATLVQRGRWLGNKR